MVRDLLMWVGEKYYPHIVDFVEEARTKGVCKRVPAPPDITTGESRCYLLHRDGGRRPRCFGYFTISDVAVLVPHLDYDPIFQKYGYGVKYATRGDFYDCERGCGEMKVGGVYIISKFATKVSEPDSFGTYEKRDLVLHAFPFPKLPVEYPNFRGYSYIERDVFLGGLTWPKSRMEKIREKEWRKAMEQVDDEDGEILYNESHRTE
jgi:hypothetical protein